jgi:hypothetical protein
MSYNFMLNAVRRKTDDFLEKPTNYYIYLVMHELLDNLELIRPFMEMSNNFGNILQDMAVLYIPMENSFLKNRQAVLSLNWHPDMKVQLENKTTPFMLLLEDPLADFQPTVDDFIIIDLPNPLDEQWPQTFDHLTSLLWQLKSGKPFKEWVITKHAKKAHSTIRRMRYFEINGGTIIGGDVQAGNDVIGRDKFEYCINFFIDSKHKQATSDEQPSTSPSDG